MEQTVKTAEEIRAARIDSPKLRERDLATNLGISEAQVVAAHVGHGVTPIHLDLENLMPDLESLGTVMGLTRNDSCVIEKDGLYANYTHGVHASMFVNEAIDLRIFPSRWVHGYMVEKDTDRGTMRSIQAFDAAGDAVHKVFLRDASNLDAWADIKEKYTKADVGDTLTPDPRKPLEAPKSNPDKLDVLLKEWSRLTDTHQFMRLTSKMKMNRLGAYRIAGAPWVRPLAPDAVDKALHLVRDARINVMVFVGNAGCIEIHSG
ncbi:MAG: ChuX/HutX family heme-like substrate-binding protein, partial [Pseudomonadota bacterium]